MSIKIGIIPSVINRYESNSLNFDTRLIDLVKTIYKQGQINLLKDKSEKDLDVIFSSGGNDLLLFSKLSRDIKRKDLENYYLNLCLKKKISYIGICYGAQFLAYKFKSKLVKDKNHVNTNHFVYSNDMKKKSVNSFHNYKIKNLSNNLETLFYAKDKSIEAFRHKNLKLIGIMWHPERYVSFRKFDIDLIKNNL